MSRRVCLYLKSWEFPYQSPSARRVEWVSQGVEVLRYGKTLTDTESWCVLYDALEGGNEIARFKGSEVTGYTYRDD
jgi:hypothetical protein